MELVKEKSLQEEFLGEYVIGRKMELFKEKSLQEEFLGEYVIARTYTAGVFAGILSKMEGKEAILNQARRLWYWDGAASLSQLAQEGTSKPDQCKFPCEVDSVLLTEVIEILLVSDKAKESIKGVKEWRA